MREHPLAVPVGYAGDRLFDMAAYDNYVAGKLVDVALDDRELERALRAIEDLPPT